MKRKEIRLPYGRMHGYTPMHPSKTAYKALGGAFDDVLIKEFATRIAMLKAIAQTDRQYDRAGVPSAARYNWIPYVKEGGL